MRDNKKLRFCAMLVSGSTASWHDLGQDQASPSAGATKGRVNRERGASDMGLLDTRCVLTWFLQEGVADSLLGDNLFVFLQIHTFLDLPSRVLAGSPRVNVLSLSGEMS